MLPRWQCSRVTSALLQIPVPDVVVHISSEALVGSILKNERVNHDRVTKTIETVTRFFGYPTRLLFAANCWFPSSHTRNTTVLTGDAAFKAQVPTKPDPRNYPTNEEG